jgi:hypothetical protein
MYALKMSVVIYNYLPAAHSVCNRTMETFVIKFVHFLFAFMIGFVRCSYHVEFNHFVFSNNTGNVLFVTEIGSP